MRQALIISVLAVAVSLHIWTWKTVPVAQFREEQGQSPEEAPGAVLMPANINASMQGDRITVAGRISDSWESSAKRAPRTLILRDGSAALEVVHWLKSPIPVDIGASVECTGTVGLYRGRIQLRLWTPQDLQVLSP
jgi:hypothetical protein